MIPTAEEWLKINYEANAINPNILIEFAKLHVEAALKAASEDADMDNEYYHSVQEGTIGRIDIETILNAYPLTNIK
jgi:hypothetical protein